MKVKAHSSSEPPPECNQCQTPLTIQGWILPCQPNWDVQEFSIFRVVLEGKIDQEILNLIKIGLLRIVFHKQSNAVNNT